jgi:glycosyltransferase involved in cell wall biosynthesis
MKISVIIPAYNRGHLIIQTLKSLIDQNFPKEDFEIIVSDNNSKDSTPAVVQSFIKDHPDYNISYYLEKRQGVHYARNSAAKISKGEFLYFTDDDMIAEPDLLKELVWLFQLDSKIASVTGIVLPKWLTPPPDWIVKYCNNGWLSLNNPGYDLLISHDDCNVYSCHQMIKRDVFFLSGGFNPENTEGVWIGDGETGINIKIKELGYKFGFNRKSVIHHIIPAERLTQQYLNKRFLNQGNCASYTSYRAHTPENKKLHFGMVIMFYQMLKSYYKSLILKAKGKDKWRLSRSKSYYWLARIKYDYKICTNASWKALVLKRNWLED